MQSNTYQTLRDKQLLGFERYTKVIDITDHDNIDEVLAMGRTVRNKVDQLYI